jgi:O-antigen/teichoic acid export membrane protein
VAATTIVNIVGYVGYALTARRVFPALTIRPSLFSRAQWREVTSFSIYLFVIQIAGQISFNIDNLVVGAFLGPAAVAVYTVALRLGDYQRRVCDQFSGMLFPVVVRFGAEGDVAALRRALIEGTRVGVTLVVAVSACLIGFSGPLIGHWMGPSFAGSVAPFVWLALAGVIVVSQAAVCNILIAVGSHRLLAAVWLAEGTANLSLSLALVRTLGLSGVALGTLVPLVFGHLFVLLPRACRAVGIDVRSCVRETMGPALVGCAAAAVACLLLRDMVVARSTSAVLAETAATAAVYFGVVTLFGFTPAVRARYRAQVAALRLWPVSRRPQVKL